MILQIFSVYDSKVELFGTPFFCRSKGEAIRSFADAVNEESHAFSRHADDYTLFHVGEFDEAEGMFTTSAGVSLGNALTFLVAPSSPDIGVL